MLDILMIPALGCDERLYAEIVPSISSHVNQRVIIADRATFDDCTEQVLAAAPPSFYILGTSFGGRVALEVTLAAPERVLGLVMIGASAGPSPDVAAGLRRSLRLRGGEFEAVVSEMASIISHLSGPRGSSTRDAFIAMANDHGAELMARQSDALAHRSDLRPKLKDIACPALMLWGVHDQFVSAKDGLALAMQIPKARYVEIPECGHFPSLEAPEETAEALSHWLADSGAT